VVLAQASLHPLPQRPDRTACSGPPAAWGYPFVILQGVGTAGVGGLLSVRVPRLVILSLIRRPPVSVIRRWLFGRPARHRFSQRGVQRAVELGWRP
jgi:hypothetical protein